MTQPEPSSQARARRQRPGFVAPLLILILLVALFLRTWQLEQVPLGVDYDEAGNLVLAQEIASGQGLPIFIRAYAGREAVFYWLAALSLRLLGYSLFAFRLTSALCGVVSIALAYLLARELFHEEAAAIRRWVPLLSATLMSTSYWAVHVNRYGFRVNAMTPLLTATMLFLWRGLRRDRWFELAIAGVLCGLSANTYLAIRAFPLLLLAFGLWVTLTWQSERHTPWLRLRQLALFGLFALLAFAPLGLFFLRHPEFFSTRMAQTSILVEAEGAELWRTLGDVILRAMGMFTVRGDGNPVYNLDRRPIFGPVLGACFYAGLLICLWRILSSGKRESGRSTLRQKTPYLLTLFWLPVMLIPTILGARDVPHSLRAMGLVPVVFVLPALGIVGAASAAQTWLRKSTQTWLRKSTQTWLRKSTQTWLRGSARTLTCSAAAVTLIALVVGGAQTGYRYFALWTQDAGAYYRGAADSRLAAEYLSRQDPGQVALWVSNDTYRHTTYGAFCSNYAHLKWFSGATLVFPAASERAVLYTFDHTNPLDPLLAHLIPAEMLQHRELGPDGGTGFEAYLIPASSLPRPEPQFAAGANLGHTIALTGYDLNQPAVSGQALDVTLYWRVLRDTVQDDYTFFVHLVDELDFRWGGETFFNYPSAQWREGDIVLFRKTIDIGPGAPPGAYRLTAGVFSPSLDARLPLLNEAGQMAGTTVELGPFEVAAADRLPQTLPPIQHPLEVAFADRTPGDSAPGGALALLGFDRDRKRIRPGETLALSLYWQAKATIDSDVQVLLWLENKDHRVPLWQGDPANGLYPFSQWRHDEFVRDRYALRLPAGTPAGAFDLRMALRRPDGTLLPTNQGEDTLLLFTIDVEASERLWEPPAIAYPVEVRLGDQVELLGYDLDRQQAKPGETLRLTLIWRCLQEMDTSYTVFTHLLDGSEQIRGQKDNPPVGGAYPTTLWVAGEIVVDEYEIAIKPDTPPGRHVIEVGMYDPANLQRLSVLDPAGAVGDRVLLGEIQVTD